jgi:hypothetical protein
MCDFEQSALPDCSLSHISLFFFFFAFSCKFSCSHLRMNLLLAITRLSVGREEEEEHHPEDGVDRPDQIREGGNEEKLLERVFGLKSKNGEKIF